MGRKTGVYDAPDFRMVLKGFRQGECIFILSVDTELKCIKNQIEQKCSEGIGTPAKVFGKPFDFFDERFSTHDHSSHNIGMTTQVFCCAFDNYIDTEIEGPLIQYG